MPSYRSRRPSAFSRTHVVRLLLLVGLFAGLAMPLAPRPVRAAGPARSGTIVGGVGETPVSPWVRGMEGCVSAASCTAWLQSGCAAELAVMEPAPQAAIVDVGDLADNTERTLTFGPELVVFGARYTVQFWTNSDNPLDGDWCGEILDVRFVSWECFRHVGGAECPVRIPPHARWMTITSSPENVSTSWALT